MVPSLSPSSGGRRAPGWFPYEALNLRAGGGVWLPELHRLRDRLGLQVWPENKQEMYLAWKHGGFNKPANRRVGVHSPAELAPSWAVPDPGDGALRALPSAESGFETQPGHKHKSQSSFPILSLDTTDVLRWSRHCIAEP